ncbi:hypothetical protein AN958_04433 [Leucoagaricus sp. SymC.cos]|nr:hypothetical protein AN958_04433 [Leucoagaricus sp. SymC.cos]
MKNFVLKNFHILSFNVNHNYLVIHSTLVNFADSVDILFFQEPTWKVARQMISADSLTDKDVIGALLHPDWVYIAPSLPSSVKLHVMAYIHHQLLYLQPSITSNFTMLDRNIMVIFLSYQQHVHYFMNMYSDDKCTVLEHLLQHAHTLPHFLYIRDDFNIQSKAWDPHFKHYSKFADQLIDLMMDLQLNCSISLQQIPTQYSSDQSRSDSTIDFIFITNDISVEGHHILADQRLWSDHAPLYITIPISPEHIPIQQKSIKCGSEEEDAFIKELVEGLLALLSADLLIET